MNTGQSKKRKNPFNGFSDQMPPMQQPPQPFFSAAVPSPFPQAPPPPSSSDFMQLANLVNSQQMVIQDLYKKIEKLEKTVESFTGGQAYLTERHNWRDERPSYIN